MVDQSYQTSLSNPNWIKSSSGEIVRSVPQRANRWHTFKLVLADIQEGGRADNVGCEIVDHGDQSAKSRRCSTDRVPGTLAQEIPNWWGERCSWKIDGWVSDNYRSIGLRHKTYHAGNQENLVDCFSQIGIGRGLENWEYWEMRSDACPANEKKRCKKDLYRRRLLRRPRNKHNEVFRAHNISLISTLVIHNNWYGKIYVSLCPCQKGDRFSINYEWREEANPRVGWDVLNLHRSSRMNTWTNGFLLKDQLGFSLSKRRSSINGFISRLEVPI